jgi:hypothetical protein
LYENPELKCLLPDYDFYLAEVVDYADYNNKEAFFTYGFNVYCDGTNIDDYIWNDYLDAYLVGIDIDYKEGIIVVNITQKEQ